MNSDSFDIISGPPAGGNHTALGMRVFTFSGIGHPVSIEVRVFDKSELELGMILLPSVPQAGTFLGMLATGGDTIGPVNIWSGDGLQEEGIFDIQTYIPAPSAWALLGLAGLCGPRRRRT